MIEVNVKGAEQREMNPMPEIQWSNQLRTAVRKRRGGFTLIELITVMAISAILLGIISIPMIQTFNATRTAQSFSDAQDRARLLTDRITREISQAMAVRDLDGAAGQSSIVLPVPTTGIDDSGATVTTPGGFLKLTMSFTKLDLVLPARVNNSNVPGQFVDPVTGKVDPTLRSPKGQVRTPMVPGNTIRRYWIGIRDPFRNYNNPYDGLLSARQGGQDNLFVLYMAEVEPVVLVNVAGNLRPQVNTAFFDADPSDPSGRTPILDDPDFFLPTAAELGTPVNNDAKAQRVQNWLQRAQIVTELSRYDMIQPVYDKGRRLVRMNSLGGGFSPRVTPLIQFRPSHVENDGTESQESTPVGIESDSAANSGPEVFRGQFGMWSNVVVRSYLGSWLPGQDYQIGRRNDTNEFELFGVNPAVTGVSDTAPGSGTPLFNVTAYDNAIRNRTTDPASRYPFTVGLNASGTLNGPAPSPALAAIFSPFTINRTNGRIIASFAIANVGDFTRNPNAPANLFSPNDPNPNNLPQLPAQSTVASGWNNTTAAFTPSTDPNVNAGTYSAAPFFDTTLNRFNINRVFNKIWADAQANRNGIPSQFGEVGNAHRFIDLRFTPQGDGTPSPLGLFPRAQIVPGTDEVFGPDQNPGANFGFEVRYKRVNREPGPNEYRINYSNLPEPTAQGYALMGLPVPPPAYNRNSFVSAIVQPRYKAGYIQLCSDPEVPIPAVMNTTPSDPSLLPGTFFTVPGRIRVAYKFQFTAPTDVVRAEYDTRQLLEVLVTIRNFPQSSVPNPQTVTMKATATVRNFTR